MTTEDTAAGFTGTVKNFLEWLGENLVYGNVSVEEPTASEIFPSRMARKVVTVTGGYSEDEALLGRVENSMFGMRFWESSHRGGMTTYEVPVKDYEKTDDPFRWLDAETTVFQTIYRARHLVVEQVDGSTVELRLPRGAQLSFEEARDENGSKDFANPAGVLTIAPMPEHDFVETNAIFARSA